MDSLLIIIIAAGIMIVGILLVVVLVKKEFGQISNQVNNYEQQMSGQMQQMETRINDLNKTTEGRLDNIDKTVGKKLDDSFARVHDQLLDVNKSVGEMQSLAKNVDDLRSIMSNTKTRGIIGEYALDSIITDMLNSNQYEKEFATVPGSREHVEYAIKLPSDDDNFVYLPVDAKFPANAYKDVLDARESGDKDAVAAALNNLKSRLKQEANDIANKYIAPPNTTPYGIAFLPSEGLFAECINLGLLDELQAKYNVTLAGPSTMGVIINSIQMMYKTVAIQKHSNEVWNTLEEVKREFAKYEKELEKTHNQSVTLEKSLNTMLTTRTNQMNRRLSNIGENDENIGVISRGSAVLDEASHELNDDNIKNAQVGNSHDRHDTHGAHIKE